MLERIALEQTRLRIPGMGLDAKGVALGQRGLVLLPTLDRLVAFFSVYTKERSLEDVIEGLEIQVVRSKLGTREVTLSFVAESSDRLDRFSECARLVGGYTFTGTSRHFVQYRDASAPFGYDTGATGASNAELLLYHTQFTQEYSVERTIDFRTMLLRLEPGVDPATHRIESQLYVVAERGLGDALIHYLVRSQVEAEVCLAEWASEQASSGGIDQQYIFRIPSLPKRLRPLLSKTPGIRCFLPASKGAAVEIGYRHPIELRACPVFPETGLVLFRGDHKAPLILERLPTFGDVRSFARVTFREDEKFAGSQGVSAPSEVRVPIRVSPSSASWRDVTAVWIPASECEMFRKLAYALPPRLLAETDVSCLKDGMIVRNRSGVEAIPLGTFYYELRPGVYLPAGSEVVPAVAPEVLYQALGSPANTSVFFRHSGEAFGVADASFGPLPSMLLEAKPLTMLATEAVSEALAFEPLRLRLDETEVPLFTGLPAPDKS
ncbi:MAG: hypothetical protein KBF88_15885 [Polyangiaceae bacterium]|nr:hypothetical protein [Polyangiaceae bacterium]